MTTLRSLLAAWLFACALPGGAADLSLMPVAVNLDRLRDRASVQVVNRGHETVILQAEAIAWVREGGVDRDEPTGELIVNPPVFSIAPGQSQVVRLGLRRSAEADRERTYRMVLREVPPSGGGDGTTVHGSVRVLVALRVPVYVAPAQVQRAEQWRTHLDAQGLRVAEVSNTGNVHMKIGALRWHAGAAASAAVAGAAPLSEQPVGAVLFPGETRSFRVPSTPGASAAQTLEVLTDRGPQYVALGTPAR